MIQLNMLPQKAPATMRVSLANGSAITISHTIPYEKVFEMIQWAVNYVVDDRAYISGPLYQIIETLAILRFYTDLDLSFLDAVELTPHDVYENYDLIANAELADSNDDALAAILSCISAKQVRFFKQGFRTTVANLVEYRNSARGVVTLLAEASKQDSAAFEKAFNEMKNPEDLEQIQNILKLYLDNSGS